MRATDRRRVRNNRPFGLGCAQVIHDASVHVSATFTRTPKFSVEDHEYAETSLIGCESKEDGSGVSGCDELIESVLGAGEGHSLVGVAIDSSPCYAADGCDAMVS